MVADLREMQENQGFSERRIDKPEFVDEALAFLKKESGSCCKIEVNGLDYMIEKAHSNGLKIALNPSPFQEDILKCGIEKVSLLFFEMKWKENSLQKRRNRNR